MERTWLELFRNDYWIQSKVLHQYCKYCYTSWLVMYYSEDMVHVSVYVSNRTYFRTNWIQYNHFPGEWSDEIRVVENGYIDVDDEGWRPNELVISKR